MKKQIWSFEENSLGGDRYTCGECERCDGTGLIPAQWPRFYLHLLDINLAMKPGKERMCALWTEYRRWCKEQTVPCPEC